MTRYGIPLLAGWTRLARVVSGLVLLAAAGLVVPAGSAAQERAPAAPEPARRVSAFLPLDHWSHGAVRRLEALGLAPAGFGGGTRSWTEREVARLFESAELEAERHAPWLAPMVRAYSRRFAEEFPRAFWRVVVPGWAVVRGQFSVGYEHEEGIVMTGVGYDPVNDWTGVRPLGGWRGSMGRATVGFGYFPYVAFNVTPALRREKPEIDDAYFTFATGPLVFWGGRRAVAFYPGRHGGIVLGGLHTFDGGGFTFEEPVRFPGWFRHLGPVRFEFFLTRVENGDRYSQPWFGALYMSIHPHPRFELGVARANIFGGEGNPITMRNLAQMIVGTHAGEDGEFNNEVLSVHARYRPPVGRLPLVVYLEWGMDDSAGAWSYVPARVLGFEVPAVPGLPQVAFGLERTTFAPSCCDNPIWYRSWSLRGGWAASGRPLGHPLAGEGSEILGFARADLLDARVNVELRAFTRNRGLENLFAPERAGRSRGGSIRFEARPVEELGLYLQGRYESGETGWQIKALNTGVQFFF